MKFQPMHGARQPRCGIRSAVTTEARTCRLQPAHRFYCGVDLHARKLFVNVLGPLGTTRLRRISRFTRPSLDALSRTATASSSAAGVHFAWYWLADLCERERIPFVLGHALAMKAIHGGKARTTASTPRRSPAS